MISLALVINSLFMIVSRSKFLNILAPIYFFTNLTINIIIIKIYKHPLFDE